MRVNVQKKLNSSSEFAHLLSQKYARKSVRWKQFRVLIITIIIFTTILEVVGAIFVYSHQHVVENVMNNIVDTPINTVGDLNSLILMHVYLLRMEMCFVGASVIWILLLSVGVTTVFQWNQDKEYKTIGALLSNLAKDTKPRSEPNSKNESDRQLRAEPELKK